MFFKRRKIEIRLTRETNEHFFKMIPQNNNELIYIREPFNYVNLIINFLQIRTHLLRSLQRIQNNDKIL